MLPETSFSMFTLEERKVNSGVEWVDPEVDKTWKCLKPHIILGKIPNDPIYGAV
jgi:hypothetical protein